MVDRDASAATATGLRVELEAIEVELEIAEAQLDLDSAPGREPFDAAVVRQIDAYRAFARLLRARPARRGDASERQDRLTRTLARGVETADARLHRYRVLSTEVSDSLKASVLAALDDLDRVQAQSRFESEPNP
jgi:hypothetical protein